MTRNLYRDAWFSLLCNVVLCLSQIPAVARQSDIGNSMHVQSKRGLSCKDTKVTSYHLVLAVRSWVPSGVRACKPACNPTGWRYHLLDTRHCARNSKLIVCNTKRDGQLVMSHAMRCVEFARSVVHGPPTVGVRVHRLCKVAERM